MKLSNFKNQLTQLSEISFQLPNGTFVPNHFHITEVGINTKEFIDCGGTIRREKYLSMQIWVASDTSHRLEAEKLLKILSMSEKVIGTEDLDLEVEYQTETIGRYSLGSNGSQFLLVPKHTDCLAKENCGTPVKQKVQLAELQTSCCSTESKCCS